MSRSYEELRDDTVDAFEESTGEVPNDYEMSVIQIGAKEMAES
jgi:hypothetical protein